MHNLDDTYPTRPGFETSTSEFRAKAGPNEPSGTANIILPAAYISWSMCFDKKIIDRNIGPTPIKVELTVYILTTLTYFLFLIFFCKFSFAARIGHTQQQQYRRQQ